MNYGYRETISKQKNLVSTGQRLSKKSLVVFSRFIIHFAFNMYNGMCPCFWYCSWNY